MVVAMVTLTLQSQNVHKLQIWIGIDDFLLNFFTTFGSILGLQITVTFGSVVGLQGTVGLQVNI